MRIKRKYNNGSEIIEIIIRDCSGMKIESRKCQVEDLNGINLISQWLKHKYGINLNPANQNTIQQDFLAFD